MTSSLSWLDYSESDRRRAAEVIDLFRETTTVDELGISSVRDSYSDLFFPGTSTVQTRACYFLLVPWTFLRLERLKVSSARVEARARQEEVNLNRRMLSGDDTRGVFGSQAREALKRLPSEVYWGGLRSWGVCAFPGHKWGYFRSLDGFYQNRDRLKSVSPDPEGRSASPTNWHPHLPAPPSGFPYGNVSVALRPQDAEYLRERIQTRHPQSLLAVLAGRDNHDDLQATRPWELSDLPEVTPVLRAQLCDAQLFAICMQGAALLYNLMLSELKKHDELIETYRGELENWAAEVGALQDAVADWRLDGVWRVVRHQGRSPAYPMQSFVERWVVNLRRDGSDAVVKEPSPARRLVWERETALKGSRTRLGSARHLELWGGRSGTGLMDYRWDISRQILKDILTAEAE